MDMKRKIEGNMTRMLLSSKSGLALIMVLWILTILSVIVLSFAFMARTEVYSTIAFRDGITKSSLQKQVLKEVSWNSSIEARIRTK